VVKLTGSGDNVIDRISGSGSDGALGIRAMKEAGSVVFVQDPNEAEYPMMPQSAIATGVADLMMPPACSLTAFRLPWRLERR
jgi:two-component system CheB/CheR fusion protein